MTVLVRSVAMMLALGWWLVAPLPPSPVATGSAAPTPSPVPSLPQSLPAPTGPHAVGRTTFLWRDETRPELETADTDDVRQGLVHVFYPADPPAGASLAVYLPDADLMAGPFSIDQVRTLEGLVAHAVADAPMVAGAERHPVLLFLPGGGMKVLTYHALLEDLASHGWVVAAMDPAFNAPAMRLPDGTLLRRPVGAAAGRPIPTELDDEVRQYRERVTEWARDVSTVVDRLESLDAGADPSVVHFEDRLDLDAGVVVAGHSRGGLAAGTARLVDARVRGAVNLDGSSREFPFMPLGDDAEVGSAPFLWMQLPIPPPPKAEELTAMGVTSDQYQALVTRVLAGWARRLAAIDGGAMRVTLDHAGIDRISFSDEHLWDGTPEGTAHAATLATIADTRTWLRAFAEGVLSDDWSQLGSLAGNAMLDPSDGIEIVAYGPLEDVVGPAR